MVTSAEIGRFLDEHAFPATREECIQMAEERSAPDDVLAALSSLQEGIYNNIHEVAELAQARYE